MTAPPPVDPGATPTTARSLAPDLARGGMLLLIALANVHLWIYGHPAGVRGYPQDLDGADQVVALVQMLLVDGRAYPLFGFLFGYGIVQLSRRRGEVGLPVDAVTRLVRRRGGWMVLIGLVHGVLLWSGDIVGAYGLIAVALAGLLVRGSDVSLLVTSAVGVFLVSVLYSGSGLAPQGADTPLLPSMTIADPVSALLVRAVEWVGVGFLLQAFSVFAAVALGAWAARRRFLDEPERHRGLLVRVAVIGIAAAILGGLPFALMTAQLWVDPPLLALALGGFLHALGGYAGGLGYAALFGLLAVRLGRGAPHHPVVRALQACGQRSLSCYLAQSVAFALLLPAWTFGLGDGAHLWQSALYAIGTWLVILAVAAVADRRGSRGPAELLLRRLTYGPRRRATQPT
ncbi:DUF418 domain-containing protein [Pseudonocardia kunmingensis]|uniref:Putative membrane protein YeiB n=1 Tax=Pseudonocardia kunmingensis TaxID=630975 RepID=A0A543DXD1_9PSEU|nr:DUF418 domain-containing protein [Pseudonocardia kunmingensis]TQM13990.1 putative membrane protein YeiB [Pseudonocardia kunmingensis]